MKQKTKEQDIKISQGLEARFDSIFNEKFRASPTISLSRTDTFRRALGWKVMVYLKISVQSSREPWRVCERK